MHGGVRMSHIVLSVFTQVLENNLCVFVYVQRAVKPRQPQPDIWPICPAEPLGLCNSVPCGKMLCCCYQDVIAL